MGSVLRAECASPARETPLSAPGSLSSLYCMQALTPAPQAPTELPRLATVCLPLLATLDASNWPRSAARTASVRQVLQTGGGRLRFQL